MPSNYTPNYQLNQWEADDRVLRTDFNADNAKIDAAIKAEADTRAEEDARLAGRIAASEARVSHFVTGTYSGTGEDSQTISLGFRPKVVWTALETGMTSATTNATLYYGGMILDGCPLRVEDRSQFVTFAEITGSGFKVYNIEDTTSYFRFYGNQEGRTYRYAAIG